MERPGGRLLRSERYVVCISMGVVEVTQSALSLKFEDFHYHHYYNIVFAVL